MAGTVEGIGIASRGTEPLERVEAVELLAGQGPRGDRHFAAEPTERDGDALTLVAAEALEAFTAQTGIELSHEESRRNLLTRGVELNDLVGKRFRVGEAECVGIELCEPCLALERLTRPGVLKGLVHRGGLRADVTRSGTVAAGDEVAEL